MRQKRVKAILLFLLCFFMPTIGAAVSLESGPFIDNPVLESSDIIEGEGNVVFFGATKAIILKPGFKVGSGARFSVKIGDFSGLDKMTDSDDDGVPDWMEYAYAGNLSLDYIPDSVKPQIVIIGSNPIRHLLGQPYNDPGANASDNIDGDITSQISVQNTIDVDQAGTYTVTYQVIDSAGNSADDAIRTVHVLEAQCYEDVTAPVISLNGENRIVHQVGRAYNDPGAVAIDYCEGDLSSQILLTGYVDFNSEGEYTLTYNVKDSSGNSAIPVQRTVSVEDNVICDELIQIETTYDYDNLKIV